MSISAETRALIAGLPGEELILSGLQHLAAGNLTSPEAALILIAKAPEKSRPHVVRFDWRQLGQRRIKALPSIATEMPGTGIQSVSQFEKTTR